MNKDIKDIYVVGFPKSGNTWLVRLLADSLSGLIGGEDKNEETEEFNERIKQRKPKPEFRITKSHSLPKDFFAEIESRPYGIVYTKRDFRDVIISAFFHTHRSIDQNKVTAQPPEGYFCTRLKYSILRILLWGRLVMLVERGWGRKGMEWHKHISSWQKVEESSSNINMSFTRYEDLVADTESELSKITEDLGLDPVTEESVSSAVDRQSFENKKQYFKEKYKETGDDKYRNLYTFMRKGESGDWKNYFSDAMIKYFDNKYAKHLKSSGYHI